LKSGDVSISYIISFAKFTVNCTTHTVTVFLPSFLIASADPINYSANTFSKDCVNSFPFVAVMIVL